MYVWVEINKHDIKQQTVLCLRRITQPCPFMFRIKQITLCEEKRGSFTSCYSHVTWPKKKNQSHANFPKIIYNRMTCILLSHTKLTGAVIKLIWVTLNLLEKMHNKKSSESLKVLLIRN